MNSYSPSNVGRESAYVEIARRAAALLIACVVLAAAGCVETAECNATVDCPDSQVCFEFVCRQPCETSDECDGDETCTPCQPAGAVENRCFGREANACVPEDA